MREVCDCNSVDDCKGMGESCGYYQGMMALKPEIIKEWKRDGASEERISELLAGVSRRFEVELKKIRERNLRRTK